MAAGAVVSPANSGAIDQPALEGGLGFYFGGDDHLRLTSWNSLASVTIVLTGRFLHLDGRVEPFSEVHTPATNRTAASSTFRRAEGWLTDLSVLVTGATPQRGQTFVRVDVVRGMGSVDTVLSTLIQGYVTATKRVAYPGSIIEDSLTGQGAIRSITGTDPAANVEIAETVPTGARWRLRSLRAQLVTDANAANREVALQVDDGTAVYFEAASGANQAASLTRQYTFAPQGVRGAAATATSTLVATSDLVLVAGHRINTATTNRQVTDNWGAPQYVVEEWLEAI